MTVSLSTSRLSVVAAIVALASGAALAACSDSNGTTIQPPYTGGTKPTPEPKPEPTVDAGSDAAEPTDADVPSDATASDAGDAAPAFAPCSAADFGGANDHSTTGNQVDISVTSGASGFTYVNPCSRLKVGGTADFAMSFTSHPLVPVAGATANPIVAQSSATDSGDYKVVFNTPGVFGFKCGIHSTMKGQIEVVP